MLYETNREGNMASRSLEEVERQIKALQAEAEELKLAEGVEQLRLIIKKYGVGLNHFKFAMGAGLLTASVNASA